MTLELRTDRSLVRAAATSTRYLHVSFTAPQASSSATRKPLSVAFVLDRSGSMEGQKIELARKAVESAVHMLRREDRFAVVVYDDQVDVLVEATHATPEARRMAAERLSIVHARGSTNLCTGWLHGCEQIADGVSPDMIARCLLLSDGLANVGTTDPDVLAERAAQLRAGYVVTSTFGVGADFDERLMASMARAGAGHFYFIEHPGQIQDMLTSELGEALEIVARGAAVGLELSPGIEAEVLNDVRAHSDGRRLRIELDDLVSNQDVSLIVKLQFPLGDPGNRASVRTVVSSADQVLDASGEIVWTFADHRANDAQSRDRRVDRLVAGIYAARARREAVERNRAGEFEEAARLLSATRRRILSYAGDDEELLSIAASLKAEEPVYAVPMSAMGLKAAHWGSVNYLRMRDIGGKALRATSKR